MLKDEYKLIHALGAVLRRLRVKIQMATEKPIRRLSSVEIHCIQGWLMVVNARLRYLLCIYH